MTQRHILASVESPSAAGSPLGVLPISANDPPKTPWINRWEFERDGKRWRVAVQVYGPVQTATAPFRLLSNVLIESAGGGQSYQNMGMGGGTSPYVTFRRMLETIDARAWIEALGDSARYPDGTKFQLVVEEVQP